MSISHLTVRTSPSRPFLYLLTILCFLAPRVVSTQEPLSPTLSSISTTTREHWMRRAVAALTELSSPCPYAAFGTAIVNHTANPAGDLICIGANAVHTTGNPTLHGEIAGIANCTAVLTDPEGPYALQPSELAAAWKQLTLYTTGEPCPMCATAIRWARFKECVYATSIDRLIELGWEQLRISSREVFDRSGLLGTETALIGGVLANETDALFGWQAIEDGKCPSGCERPAAGGVCRPL